MAPAKAKIVGRAAFIQSAIVLVLMVGASLLCQRAVYFYLGIKGLMILNTLIAWPLVGLQAAIVVNRFYVFRDG